MLPGDYLALRLSGQANTTVSGLSEGMFWDFREGRVADFLMDYYGFDSSLISDIVPTFSIQSRVSAAAAAGTLMPKRCLLMAAPAWGRGRRPPACSAPAR